MKIIQILPELNAGGVAGKFLGGNRSANLLRLLAEELYIDHGSDNRKARMRRESSLRVEAIIVTFDREGSAEAPLCRQREECL
jgi:hypothetical protein